MNLFYMNLLCADHMLALQSRVYPIPRYLKLLSIDTTRDGMDIWDRSIERKVLFELDAAYE